MGDKLRKFVQEQSDKEAEAILAELDKDPSLKDLKAPDSILENLYAQIDAYEAEREKEKSKFTPEESELIELGKKYKKKKKLNKNIAAVAAVAIVLSVSGITAVGGPEKIAEKLEYWLAGTEQDVIVSDDERVEVFNEYDETEAYMEIEEKYGFMPVRLNYLPKGMKFKSFVCFEDIQTIRLLYQSSDDCLIKCMIYTNYRVGSKGNFIDDILMEERIKTINGVPMEIRHYQVETNDEDRWLISFEYNKQFYDISIYNLTVKEVDKILENFYWQ